MFDIGMTELLVIGVVALIVVGPKDLPGMFRTLGRFTGKMRGMAREFSRAMNDAADEAGVKDVASTLKGATSPSKMGLDRLNDAVDKFEKWTPGKSTKPSASGAAPGAQDMADSAATSPVERGPQTQKLTEERAEAARKIHDMTAKRAAEKAEVAGTADEAPAMPAKAEPVKAAAAPTLSPAPKPASQTAVAPKDPTPPASKTPESKTPESKAPETSQNSGGEA